MTLALAVNLPQRILLCSDSRATWKHANGKTVTRDVSQKIFDLTSHSAVTFCGDIELAGILISDLADLLKRKPRCREIEVLALQADRFLNYSFRRACEYLDRPVLDTDLLLAGVSRHVSRERIGMPNHANADKAHVVMWFRFRQGGQVRLKGHRVFINNIQPIGSGAALIKARTVDDLIRARPEDECLRALICKDQTIQAPLFTRMFLEPLLMDCIRYGNVADVGGMIQCLSIGPEGVRASLRVTCKNRMVDSVEWRDQGWSKYERARGSVFRLLSCQAVARIRPISLADIGLDDD